MEASSNVAFKNNVIFGFVKIGLNINTCMNITVDGNFIGDVIRRAIISFDMGVDHIGALLSCAYIKGDSCSSISITNNIVAGIFFTGYAAYGHDCGNYNSNNFKNNIAHSVQGTGAIIFKDPQSTTQSQCFEASKYYAYKNTLDGAVSFFDYKEI